MFVWSKPCFLLLTEGDLTDFLSTSTPCWPCRQAVNFLCVLWETCLTSSRRFSTWQREKMQQVRRKPPTSSATAPGLRSQDTMTKGGSGRQLEPGARKKILVFLFLNTHPLMSRSLLWPRASIIRGHFRNVQLLLWKTLLQLHHAITQKQCPRIIRNTERHTMLKKISWPKISYLFLDFEFSTINFPFLLFYS